MIPSPNPPASRPTPAREALSVALAARERDRVRLTVHDADGAVVGSFELTASAHSALSSRPARHELREVHAVDGTLIALRLVELEHHMSVGARLSDPMTSHESAPSLPDQESVAYAMLELLEHVNRLDGWTADEISTAIDTEHYPPHVRAAARGSWRRVSDLKRLGLIEVATYGGALGDKPRRRPGRSGRPQQAHRVSDKGAAYLQEVRDRLAD